MSVHTLVRPNAYYDSVTLMAIARQVTEIDGVRDAVLVMGTAANKELLAGVGLLDDSGRDAGPGDLIVAISGDDDQALQRAVALVAERLAGRGGVGAERSEQAPPTLALALASRPDANLALISVPGPYAAREARRALQLGLNVMLFSDNVALADEVELKRLAHARGLLLMGPDCGTAIIGGVGLGFANAVRSGRIGIVAASGTGAQAVSVLIDRLGEGISHLIGTGGRDLAATVGGAALIDGIGYLAADAATEAIVLVAKPPAPGVAERVLAAAGRASKPVVACFLGADTQALAAPDGVRLTATIDAAALAAVEAVREQAAVWPWAEPDIEALARAAAGGLAAGQRYVRGLFTGGTLCDEAMAILSRTAAPIYANVPLRPEWALPDPSRSQGHTCVDLGDDFFTVGRPHPMIDPAARLGRLVQEGEDPQVAVILLDVVLGYGCHPDPAGALAPTIARLREAAIRRGGDLAVVAAVCGTDADPQNLGRQEESLRQAGALVLPTAALAAQVAARIIRGRGL